MKDLGVIIGLNVAFALLVTAHVAIVFGLAKHTPRWRALAAFAVPPLAPYWAAREHMKGRTVLWITAAVLYFVALVLATR